MSSILRATFSASCPRLFKAIDKAPKETYRKVNKIAYEEALRVQNNLTETLFKMPNVVSLSVQEQKNNPSNYCVRVGVISSLIINEIPSEYVLQSANSALEPKSVPILVEVVGEIIAQ